MEQKLYDIYPATLRALGERAFRELMPDLPGDPESIEIVLSGTGRPYIGTLARIEHALYALGCLMQPADDDGYTLNPTLSAIESAYKGLSELAMGGDAEEAPSAGNEVVLVYRDPGSGGKIARAAEPGDLLAMKMVMEGLAPEEVAAGSSVSTSDVLDLLEEAAGKGVLIKPAPLLRRPEGFAPMAMPELEEYLEADTFTLQWHITHACGLHCAHCYDRTLRGHMGLDEAIGVLGMLEAFCRERRVRGHVTFTGGHPFLYPHLTEVYAEAVRRGFGVAMAGNPETRQRLEGLCRIALPAFYQVSLEGLGPHNDSVRGQGHYRRTLEFLRILDELGIYSMVMLTLTEGNYRDVLPLAGELQGRVDSFNFNRLSSVGQAHALRLPATGEFRAFIAEYIASDNPVRGMKENLMNLARWQSGGEFFGGCTGHGCGAAFNFVSLLPDGEVHACRKFPSLIGNVREGDLSAIYDSDSALSYRMGPSMCGQCAIRPVCGGCQAVIHSAGGDIRVDRDAYCWLSP